MREEGMRRARGPELNDQNVIEGGARKLGLVPSRCVLFLECKIRVRGRKTLHRARLP
jgi:hypothetical protein